MSHRLVLLLVVLVVCSIGSISVAQIATFEIDQTASSLAVSGTAAGAPIQQQGPGSLSTTYAGPLLVQLGPGSIAFPGGSAVKANNSGNWQPGPGGVAGTAPANYGGRVVIVIITSYAAVRDAIFDATSASPIVTSTGNSASFTPTATFTATSGVIDFASPLAGSGSESLVGAAADNDSPNSASLTITPAAGGFANATLIFPARFTITTTLGTFGQGVFNFNGSFTGRATARGGDANFDGAVNLTDFNVLAGNFGSTGGGWRAADFNFDNQVNLNDFNILAGNFGLSASPGGPTQQDWDQLASAVVPEPASSMTFAIALSLLTNVRSRPRAFAS